MSDEAIVMVADAAYLQHAKALLTNCRREGKWDGDFVLIHHVEANVDDFRGRGITLFGVPDSGFLAKFHVFSPMLRQWKRVFYLDLDCLVQDDLRRVFEHLRDAPSLPNGTKPIIADLEDVQAIVTWQRCADQNGGQAELMARLVQLYPHVNERFWNTAFLLFEPASIPRSTVEALFFFQLAFEPTNMIKHGGTDQQIIHALLYERFRRVEEKVFCYYGLDNPRHRGPSEFRGWRGGEVPAVVHYCRWDAPWVSKLPGAFAFKSQRLGDTTYKIYQRNLAAFEETFPCL